MIYTSKDTEAIQARIAAEREAVITSRERHPSVAHINVHPWRYVEAARKAEKSGDRVRALQLIGKALGMAETLRASVPVNENWRETQAHVAIVNEAAAMRLRALRALEHE